MHFGASLMLLKHMVDFGAVADVCLFTDLALAVVCLREALKITRISEFVEVDHFIFVVANDIANHSGAHKAGAAGYQ